MTCSQRQRRWKDLCPVFQHVVTHQARRLFADTGQETQDALAFTNVAWYMPVISLFERMTAMTIHIVLSVMVWRAYTRRAWGWFAGAIFYHAFIDALAVTLISLGYSIFLIEGILGVFMVINLGLLYLAYHQWGQEPGTAAVITPGEDEENLSMDNQK